MENVNNMDNVAAVAATDADGNVQFWGKLAKGAIRGGIQAAAQHNLWVSNEKKLLVRNSALSIRSSQCSIDSINIV